jgi:hypothetical protein
MSPEMRVALEIAAASGVLLFAAIGALDSLLYLLTNPSLFGEPARERRRAKRRARRMKKRRGRDAQQPLEQHFEEQSRRRRAAALAAAVARAEHETSAVPHVDGPAEWRLLHRELRLQQRPERRA